ncbi:la-related protein 6B isoform X2 [Coffea arabica]|uniref:La-related protein 6B isoform X2 n=1 Tax=Coffea arabica TaxID=13443 RepID=A0A6P6WRE6_COFAR|nr:la-related protein 6B isoform X2 [Coffea arabica]
MMDASAAASTSSSSSAGADYLPETLSRSYSSSLLDHDRPLHRFKSSSLSSSPSDPCLYKSASLSKLNARAPEFVPRISISSAAASPSSSPSLLSPSVSSPSLSSLSSSCGNLLSLVQSEQQSDLAATFVVPRPPGVPSLVHVFNSNGASSSASSRAVFQLTSSSLDTNLASALGYPSQLQLYGVAAPGFGGFLNQQQDLSVLAHSSSDAFDPSKIGLSEEIALKIINQVEFYFSDINLATTGFLYKIMVKDPEGFVPISVIASIKKIKTLTKSQSQLASVLKGSSKLVVSEDGKKVRRLHPLTELDMEDVQSRIIIAENLPEDHCHQNLLKIFSAVGSVKSIRSCQPSGPTVTSTSRAAKGDPVNFSNKLHAFVEYESVELAEKAVLELNEGNWRNGLKVRLLLKRSARDKKAGHEGEYSFKDEDGFGPEHIQQHEKCLDDFVQPPNEPMWEEHGNNKEGGLRKSRSREFREVNENRGWGKGRGRPAYNSNNRGNHPGVASNVPLNIEQPTAAKQPPVPRMPDGTKGFSMGRGKPVAVRIV